MPIPTAIGLNLTKLNNISTPSASQLIGISLSDPTKILGQIVTKANQNTGDYLGIVIMLALAVLIYYVLTDRTQFATFGYNDMRGLSVSIGISFIMGLTLIECGWIREFQHVAIIGVLYVVALLFVIISENQE